MLGSDSVRIGSDRFTSVQFGANPIRSDLKSDSPALPGLRMQLGLAPLLLAALGFNIWPKTVRRSRHFRGGLFPVHNDTFVVPFDCQSFSTTSASEPALSLSHCLAPSLIRSPSRNGSTSRHIPLYLTTWLNLEPSRLQPARFVAIISRSQFYRRLCNFLNDSSNAKSQLASPKRYTNPTPTPRLMQPLYKQHVGAYSATLRPLMNSNPNLERLPE